MAVAELPQALRKCVAGVTLLLADQGGLPPSNLDNGEALRLQGGLDPFANLTKSGLVIIG